MGLSPCTLHGGKVIWSVYYGPSDVLAADFSYSIQINICNHKERLKLTGPIQFLRCYTFLCNVHQHIALDIRDEFFAKSPSEIIPHLLSSPWRAPSPLRNRGALKKRKRDDGYEGGGDDQDEESNQSSASQDPADSPDEEDPWMGIPHYSIREDGGVPQHSGNVEGVDDIEPEENASWLNEFSKWKAEAETIRQSQPQGSRLSRQVLEQHVSAVKRRETSR
jgi:hypothetical protein